jgi:hypothetical protein
MMMQVSDVGSGAVCKAQTQAVMVMIVSYGPRSLGLSHCGLFEKAVPAPPWPKHGTVQENQGEGLVFVA